MKTKERITWVGIKPSEMATLIAICNAVAWKKRTSNKLTTDALAMAIRLEGTFKTFPKTK